MSSGPETIAGFVWRPVNGALSRALFSIRLIDNNESRAFSIAPETRLAVYLRRGAGAPTSSCVLPSKCHAELCAYYVQTPRDCSPFPSQHCESKLALNAITERTGLRGRCAGPIISYLRQLPKANARDIVKETRSRDRRALFMSASSAWHKVQHSSIHLASLHSRVLSLKSPHPRLSSANSKPKKSGRGTSLIREACRSVLLSLLSRRLPTNLLTALTTNCSHWLLIMFGH